MVYLGYYTDPSSNPRGKKSGGWLLPILFGIAVGVLLMIVVYLNLLGKKTINNENSGQQTETTQPEKDDAAPREHITADVSTRIHDIVYKVSITVVVLTNIQLQSDFSRN